MWVGLALLSNHFQIVYPVGSPFVSWPRWFQSVLRLVCSLAAPEYPADCSESAGEIAVVHRCQSALPPSVTRRTPPCMCLKSTFFFFSFWFVAEKGRGWNPRKQISVRCDLAAHSPMMLSAKAWPAPSQVPGMMLAHVPWLREDVNPFTSVARRGRAGVVSEVVRTYSALIWRPRASSGGDTIEVLGPELAK